MIYAEKGEYTFCDSCGQDMDSGWMRHTGRIDDEFNVPIVEFLCNTCWEEDSDGHEEA